MINILRIKFANILTLCQFTTIKCFNTLGFGQNGYHFAHQRKTRAAPCGTQSLGLIHWGRVTHICVNKLTIIGSDNGLLPGRRQAIIWTNAAILLIEPLWTNFSEILIKSPTFSFKKMRLKKSSGKWGPYCLSLNVLKLDWKVCFSYRISQEIPLLILSLHLLGLCMCSALTCHVMNILAVSKQNDHVLSPRYVSIVVINV